jgi:hypothetical protein
MHYVHPTIQAQRDAKSYEADYARADVLATEAENVAKQFTDVATARRADANAILTNLNAAKKAAKAPITSL